MKNILKAFIFSLLFLTTFNFVAFAHQPRIPDGDFIKVLDPEISKAFYSELDGGSHTYSISSEIPFKLYVNILAPDIEGQKTDLFVHLYKDGGADPFAVLNGKEYEWEVFFEPFGYDSYLMGPEYEEEVGPGVYDIVVSSPNFDSKYSLATGKKEAFDFKESVNALKLIPIIKKDFFEKIPVDFIFSPFGWGLILLMFILAFVFGFVYRYLLRKFAQGKARRAHHNIGVWDRILRLSISLILLGLAITTTWNPILLFFSGFTLFEAIFSWCGFYAAIGKSSCPL